MPRQFIPRRADLIGMRRGENFHRGIARILLSEHIQPHVAALAEHFAINQWAGAA